MKGNIYTSGQFKEIPPTAEGRAYLNALLAEAGDNIRVFVMKFDGTEKLAIPQRHVYAADLETLLTDRVEKNVKQLISTVRFLVRYLKSNSKRIPHGHGTDQEVLEVLSQHGGIRDHINKAKFLYDTTGQAF